MEINVHIHEAPGALKKSAAIAYCCGSPQFFERLCQRYPTLLKPVSHGTTKAGIIYLREDLDRALRAYRDDQC